MNEITRIRMIIEYDGSEYHGFQRQANANTIQEELERAIARLTGEKVTVWGAGRTDAGVHALGQVIAFDSGLSIPEDRWAIALNTYLPRDIRVLQANIAAPDFHPQFGSKRKTYVYKIYRANLGTSFYRRYACCYTDVLDLEPMHRATRHIVGVHNFQAFCASGSKVKSYEREVYQCRLLDEWPWLTLVIEANGFLYNMVRIVMGTLLLVGQGKLQAEDVVAILESRDRTRAWLTVGPQGLYMLKVEY